MKKLLLSVLLVAGSVSALLAKPVAADPGFTGDYRGYSITCRWNRPDDIYPYYPQLTQQGIWVIGINPTMFSQSPMLVIPAMGEWAEIGECRSRDLNLEFTLIGLKDQPTTYIVDPR